MRKLVLLSTILFATPFAMECQAANCATTDCYGLGYTLTSKSDNCLQCPFGNYWFCPQAEEGGSGSCDSSYKYTCTGTNQSPSGDSCDGKYKECKCANGYTWMSGVCVQAYLFCGHVQTYTTYTLPPVCQMPGGLPIQATANNMKICISNDGTQYSVIESTTQSVPLTTERCQYLSNVGGKENVVDTSESCCVTSNQIVSK